MSVSLCLSVLHCARLCVLRTSDDIKKWSWENHENQKGNDMMNAYSIEEFKIPANASFESAT